MGVKVSRLRQPFCSNKICLVVQRRPSDSGKMDLSSLITFVTVDVDGSEKRRAWYLNLNTYNNTHLILTPNFRLVGFDFQVPIETTSFDQKDVLPRYIVTVFHPLIFATPMKLSHFNTTVFVAYTILFKYFTR